VSSWVAQGYQSTVACGSETRDGETNDERLRAREFVVNSERLLDPSLGRTKGFRQRVGAVRNNSGSVREIGCDALWAG
jgi:hypothetical protein